MFRRAARKPIWGRFAAASSLTPNVSEGISSEGISSEGISSEGISSEGIGAWSAPNLQSLTLRPLPT